MRKLNNCDSSPLNCKEQETTKKRKGVLFVECGLHMFCIAYMICGYDVVEQFAIALPYIARNKKIQRSVRARDLSNIACICLYSIYDMCL